MSNGNIQTSTKSVLEGIRNRLESRIQEADPYWMEVFAELDPLWEPHRPASSEAPDPSLLGIGADGKLMSCPCCRQMLYSDDFLKCLFEMGYKKVTPHRKAWEFGFIAQALTERGILVPGKRGIGFAVGSEPLPSYFGSKGCEVLATDLDFEQASTAGWVQSNQHANSLEQLNKAKLMTDEEFRRLVSFRSVDMTKIPTDLGKFDFMWSSCSFEHLGSIQLGKEFIWNSFDLLASGGVAVHTTEYNLDSDWLTMGVGGSVIFRRSDLEEIAEGIRRKGGRIRFDFREGSHPQDLHVDPPPYDSRLHLRLRLFGYQSTSFGLIIERD